MKLTDEQVRIARAAYYGLVTFMDETDWKASIYAGGHPFLARNTLIIYTSDHGEMAGEHRMWWKSSFLSRTPLAYRFIFFVARTVLPKVGQSPM